MGKKRSIQAELGFRLRQAKIIQMKNRLKEVGLSWEEELPEASMEEQKKAVNDFLGILKELEKKKNKPIEEKVRMTLVDTLYGVYGGETDEKEG
jgi:hypothetical protein